MNKLEIKSIILKMLLALVLSSISLVFINFIAISTGAIFEKAGVFYLIANYSWNEVAVRSKK